MFKLNSKIVLVFVAICAFFVIQKDITYARVDDQTINSVVTRFVDKLMSTEHIMNRKSLMIHYCESFAMFTTSSDDNTAVLNAKKSLFVYSLCKVVANGTGLPELAEPFKSEDILLKENELMFDKFESECKIDVEGFDAGSRNDINFVCISKSIFNMLMNDYMNFALYKAWGGVTTKNEINQFLKAYFHDTADPVCDEGKYINEYPNMDKPYCRHPQTYEEIQNRLTDVEGLWMETELIIGRSFLDSKTWLNWMPVNFEGFTNAADTMYNELYFYNLFLLLWSDNISSDVVFTPSVIANDLGDSQKLIDLEVGQALKEMYYSQYSMQTTLRILKNIKRTYPLHIGFRALIEDLDVFGGLLADIYTPMHQLNYKLINSHELSAP